MASSAAAREESRRDFAKTAALPAGRALRVEHQFGRVSIRTHARPEVQIRATIRCSAPTADEARRAAEQVQIAVDEGASGVTVHTRYPSNWPRNVSYAADYDIVMPETAPLDLRNRFGSTDVSNLHANATVNSGNGSVTFLAGRGSQRIENSFGPVEVRNNAGDVAVNSQNGRVTVTDVAGAVTITNRFATIRAANIAGGLTIRSNNGNIDAENIGATANITNSFGRVSVTEAKGPLTVQNQNGEVVINGVAGPADVRNSFSPVSFTRVARSIVVRAQNSQVRGDSVNESATVETTFGTVDLRGVRGAARVTTSNSAVRLSAIGGEVYAKGSFGGVTVTDAAGPVTVENQNGSVTVDAKAGGPCQPLALRTTFSPIRVTVPRGAGYNLAARTTFGRIHTDGNIQVTVSGDISPDSLTGRIGGGGCELRLNGQNSNIDILGR